MKVLQALLISLIFTLPITAQQISPKVLKQRWQANWIAPQNVNLKDFGVFHFRKNFDLSQKPTTFIINVSGDNRYRLFVNGHFIGTGPARSDLMHWNFETFDIAQYLTQGKNTIAAVVWNFGEYMPAAQMSNKTGFIIQGNTELESVANTNNSWKVLQNQAYKPIPVEGSKLRTYIVVGCGEEVDATKFPSNWEKPSFDDSQWLSARTLEHGYISGTGSGAEWYLVPRTIPQMEEIHQNINTVRRFESTKTITMHDNWLKGKGSLTIPANSKTTILLDQTFETVAYPEIIVSGGKSADITFTYAEALIDEKWVKGNRNEIEGKRIIGIQDIFHPDGQAKSSFKPLWFRTYRYIEITIVTKEQPLAIDDYYGLKTGYPFEEKANFSSNDPSLQNIWKVGWQTARLCAGESYFDCPYYEQLQYTGDTRIQALISLYVSGDDRLMRKALTDFNNSMTSEGLTQSRYPCNTPQIIPTFSLFWVSMAYDYWMHRKDDAFMKTLMPNIEKVLGWYERKIDPQKNMLGAMNWWSFVDWAKPWRWNAISDIGGVPDGATDGNSSIISFQYAYTLRQAAAIYETYGDKEKAIYYRTLADLLSKSSYEQCWDATKNEVADTPDKKAFSQHANIFAILANAVPKANEKAIMDKILNDPSLTQATFYFRFYLTQALKKTGSASLYYDTLTPWRDMLKTGLTTFAEQADPTRSDCHAWSASPNYDFLATICGIMPDVPGFEEVRIQPSLGTLENISGKMPHPNGDITVKLNRKDKTGIQGEVTLPPNLSGRFVWNGKTVSLVAGKQVIDLE
ncbi:alpha-L-rhamnosidase N-terminal domain-containing protein [Arcicella aquatica]|uniref:Alpha-L-rhamnosidase N-terminal domain-containing protein n=1 Tax=Arcicella aquatica TaxID=217141 RepID=A0ABU5QP27_9BACT|nr:alpha-L-rhamnosidase N-terminal domain-containing protein [Arcicella aquatica]MEA5258827.1 alpha-L-rhamnosidase N-terminal domain-containing protein [Arcicella aquatica]